jgi:hypothetical protein
MRSEPRKIQYVATVDKILWGDEEEVGIDACDIEELSWEERYGSLYGPEVELVEIFRERERA